MLVPLSWLKDYVTLPDSPAELVERLTVAGLEVTAVRVAGVPVPDGLRAKVEAGLVWDAARIVVGRVLAIDKHPQADKLKMVTIDYGAAEPKTVITGAPNIAVGESGQFVVVGLNGSDYYTADKNGVRAVATLVPKELRGIANDAMCMSEFELGLSEDHDGIILLDPGEALPGTPAQELLGEVTLEIDVLPNMARCLGLVGVAREVSALTGQPLSGPELLTHAAGGEAPVTVTLADPALCVRYTATLLTLPAGLATPRRMRSRLQSMGQRTKSFAVDVSNFVLFELNQPTHAFDHDVLLKRASGGKPKLTVRYAVPGERLVTLDGVDRALAAETPVIADEAGVIALAGVMGGRETEVTASTRRILLESATFDPVAVRRSARQYQLFSEASTRFSKGIGPELALLGARRVVYHLTAGTGAEVVGRVVDEYPNPAPEVVVDLTRDELERVLGDRLPDELVGTTLERLGYRWQGTSWGWRVTTPEGRLDIQAGVVDVIEDIARVVGYDRLPERLLPFELVPPRPDPAGDLADRVRDLLTRLGYDEAVTYSLSSELLQARYAPGAFVELVNPISPERQVMRRSLLPELVAVALENLRHRTGVLHFEVGSVYLPRDGQTLPDEPARLALVATGAEVPEAWDAPLKPTATRYDLYDLKGAIETLAESLAVPLTFEPVTDVPYLHPGRSAAVLSGGTRLGTLGELHPELTRHHRDRRTPVVAELDLGALLAALPARTAFRSVSPFERSLRDIAVVVPEATPAAAVESEIRAGAGTALESVQLFDVYRGDSIPPGTKSLAYALSYRQSDRELPAKEVDALHKKVEGRLRHVLKATIRGQEG